eukprot:SAG22_NODE_1864_length_3414_cov_1.391855_5_plen_122_part_00
MVVGPAGCGKTKIWNVLMHSLTELGSQTVELRMNPKAITVQQMFGQLDAATNDWTDGIFSALWRQACKAKNKVSGGKALSLPCFHCLRFYILKTVPFLGIHLSRWSGWWPTARSTRSGSRT